MDAYDRVLDTLKARGWTQGVNVDSQGRMCLDAVIARTCASDERARVEAGIVRVIKDQYPEAWHGVQAIVAFNDSEGTTQADVEAVVEKARTLPDNERRWTDES